MDAITQKYESALHQLEHTLIGMKSSLDNYRKKENNSQKYIEIREGYLSSIIQYVKAAEFQMQLQEAEITKAYQWGFDQGRKSVNPNPATIKESIGIHAAIIGLPQSILPKIKKRAFWRNQINTIQKIKWHDHF